MAPRGRDSANSTTVPLYHHPTSVAYQDQKRNARQVSADLNNALVLPSVNDTFKAESLINLEPEKVSFGIPDGTMYRLEEQNKLNTKWYCSGNPIDHCYNLVYGGDGLSNDTVQKISELLRQNDAKHMQCKLHDGLLSKFVSSIDANDPDERRPVIGGFGIKSSDFMCNKSNDIIATGPMNVDVKWPDDTCEISEKETSIEYKAVGGRGFFDAIVLYWTRFDMYKNTETSLRTWYTHENMRGLRTSPTIFGIKPLYDANGSLDALQTTTDMSTGKNQHLRMLWSENLCELPITENIASSNYTNSVPFAYRPFSSNEHMPGGSTTADGHIISKMLYEANNDESWWAYTFFGIYTTEDIHHPLYAKSESSSRASDWWGALPPKNTYEKTLQSDFGFIGLQSQRKEGNVKTKDYKMYQRATDVIAMFPVPGTKLHGLADGWNDTNGWIYPKENQLNFSKDNNRWLWSHDHAPCIPGSALTQVAWTISNYTVDLADPWNKHLPDPFVLMDLYIRCAQTPTAPPVKKFINATVFRCPYVGMGLSDVVAPLTFHPALRAVTKPELETKFSPHAIGWKRPGIAFYCDFHQVCKTNETAYTYLSSVGNNLTPNTAGVCDGYCGIFPEKCLPGYVSKCSAGLDPWCNYTRSAKINKTTNTDVPKQLLEKYLETWNPRITNVLALECSKSGFKFYSCDRTAKSTTDITTLAATSLGSGVAASAAVYYIGSATDTPPPIKGFSWTTTNNVNKFKWTITSPETATTLFEKYPRKIEEALRTNENLTNAIDVTYYAFFDATIDADALKMTQKMLSGGSLLNSNAFTMVAVANWSLRDSNLIQAVTALREKVLPWLIQVAQRLHQNDSVTNTIAKPLADEQKKIKVWANNITDPVNRAAVNELIDRMFEDFLQMLPTQESWSATKTGSWYMFDYYAYYSTLLTSMNTEQNEAFIIPVTNASFPAIETMYTPPKKPVSNNFPPKIQEEITARQIADSALTPADILVTTCEDSSGVGSGLFANLRSTVLAKWPGTQKSDIPALCCKTGWKHVGTIGTNERFCCGTFDATTKKCNGLDDSSVTFRDAHTVTVPYLIQQICSQALGFYNDNLLFQVSNQAAMKDLLKIPDNIALVCDTTTKRVSDTMSGEPANASKPGIQSKNVYSMEIPTYKMQNVQKTTETPNTGSGAAGLNSSSSGGGGGGAAGLSGGGGIDFGANVNLGSGSGAEDEDTDKDGSGSGSGSSSGSGSGGDSMWITVLICCASLAFFALLSIAGLITVSVMKSKRAAAAAAPSR
jgi:hypothetical protein